MLSVGMTYMEPIRNVIKLWDVLDLAQARVRVKQLLKQREGSNSRHRGIFSSIRSFIW